MEKEELKSILDAQFDAFKSSLPKFVDEAGMKKAFADFKTDITAELGDAVKASDFKSLEEAVKAQGIAIAENNLRGEQTVKGFKDDFKEKLVDIQEAIKAGRAFAFPTSRKAINSTNFTSDTMAYRASGVGEIKRGMPFLRDLFQVVQLGADSHDTVSWFEQLAVVNGAKNVAEERTETTSSTNVTWVQKNLNGARINDWVKISLDRLKDVQFVAGEVQRLVERNMRLKENSQLLSGLGTGNEVAGILTYATDFVTTDIAIDSANVVDLLGKIKTQISTDTLGAALPTTAVTNRMVTDTLRYKKDTQGRYVFDGLATGAEINVGGMNVIENPLMTDNTLLAGDFSLATLYVWDDLMIEIAQIGNDKLDGKTTIMAYMRENLRVQDVDKKAFVYVSDVATTLSTITTPVA
jgi:HK97 family phage major capsid protein